MNIALIGYGKMGRELEKVALEKGHAVMLRISSGSTSLLSRENFKGIDVAIEFSTPATVMNHIRFCMDNDVPVVVGTTGWHEQIDEVRRLCLDRNGALFYASNFSIGVNIFFELNRKLASMMNNRPYQVSMEEIHHLQKKDKPSGTAISLAQQIIESSTVKKKWRLAGNDPDNNNSDEIAIRAIREGEVTGTHTVTWQSAYDKITMQHEASSRAGFAEGAVTAAEWLIHRKGFFTMNDMLSFAP